jgi:hypothetical protein
VRAAGAATTAGAAASASVRSQLSDDDGATVERTIRRVVDEANYGA